MAFFAQTGQTPMGRLSEQLGKNLGAGFSRGIGENIANKKQLQQQAGLAQLLFGQQAEGNPQAQQMMQQFSQFPVEVQLKAYESMKPKAPAGGVTAQPIPPEIARAVNEILNENPNATADELGIKFAERNVPLYVSNSYVENRRRSDETRSKVDQQKFEADRAYHTKASEPIIEESNAVLKSAPIKKGLIAQQRRDIASGNTEGILPFLAEKTGIEIWRNPESARFKTVGKQRFIEGLNSIGGGARPNQFLEQQLMSAQPAIGRDAEANNTVLDIEEFMDDMQEQRARFVREYAKEDREKYGYVRNDVAERADEKMADYAEKRQKQLAYDIRQRREENLTDEQLVKDVVSGNISPGTPLTQRMAAILMIKNNDDPKKAFAEAKRLGFDIPKD